MKRLALTPESRKKPCLFWKVLPVTSKTVNLLHLPPQILMVLFFPLLPFRNQSWKGSQVLAKWLGFCDP